MATLAWVVFKHHKKVDGTYNPKIKVYHNGTTVYLPTPIYTSLVRFKRGESTGTITDGSITDALNGRVKEIRRILNTHDYIIENCEDAKAVAAFIDKKLNQDKNIDFISFAKEFTEKLKDNGSKSVKRCLISSLCSFAGSDCIPARKITSTFLSRFENWMKSERIVRIGTKERKRPPMANSSVQTYMEALQNLYNNMLLHYNDYEIGDIVIPGDPFKTYKVKQNVVYLKKAVDVSIIRKIAVYQPVQKRCFFRTLARDMFMLSFCLAGINPIDIFNCDTFIAGRIEYTRTKTRNRKKDKAFISVPVFSEILEIFERYRDKSNVRVFDLYSRFTNHDCFRQGLAFGMRSMCKDLGIEPITFYAARHSFATIARNDCNVSMEDIALCLTHASGYKMTDTYVKLDFSRVDKVIGKVLDLVFHGIMEEAK